MTDPIIACCGLICNECPAWRGLARTSEEARARWAQEWSTEALPLTAKDLDCEGCIGPDDQLAAFCRDCDIRRCGTARGVSNCAHCADFPCEKLERAAAEARATLERLRREL